MASPLTKMLDPNAAAPAVDDAATEASTAQGSSHDATFRKIFEKHAPLVWRALRHLGVREGDIPDQSQEVFVVVYRRIGSFEGRSTLDTWIYGICLRVASEYRRRAQFRREVVQDDIDLGAVEASQAGDVERSRARARLLQLLEALDEPQREVFVLYEIEGLDMKQIAQLMDCPLQTAYSRLRLARNALLGAFAEAQAQHAPASQGGRKGGGEG